ncbi:rhamnogalacturonan acetylesterase [Niabella sp. CC-SYL272]|uniref:rhamnogalacturonan acetylesterase n=1 Tax=Niabella agricola TaxID=2891571 RepID=UPI001F39B9F2|nr:rhamnogalacturonan acetylesterase [Niabella agricola]MCF3110303.1 rhamnogalacturonan acetylesterase [Niabella agricola]
MKKTWTGILLVFLSAFAPVAEKKTKIFLAGDSTMAIKDQKAFPETGWGMPFVYFWDTSVIVVNKAKNGRSTSSFKKEGLWQSIIAEAGAGDYVLIQFGHNDEVPTKKTYTPEPEFKSNLLQFINETRSKGAVPVLITPVGRRKFDTAGMVTETHAVYSGIVREVAKVAHTPFIDLDRESQQLYQQLGEGPSRLLFMHLLPGEHPHYPAGKTDDTHFTELGARKVAELVLFAIRKQLPELARHIYQPATP